MIEPATAIETFAIAYSLLKYQIYSRYQKQASQRMIPFKRLAFKSDRTESDKYNKRNNLLNYF